MKFKNNPSDYQQRHIPFNDPGVYTDCGCMQGGYYKVKNNDGFPKLSAIRPTLPGMLSFSLLREQTGGTVPNSWSNVPDQPEFTALSSWYAGTYDPMLQEVNTTAFNASPDTGMLFTNVNEGDFGAFITPGTNTPADVLLWTTQLFPDSPLFLTGQPTGTGTIDFYDSGFAPISTVPLTLTLFPMANVIAFTLPAGTAVPANAAWFFNASFEQSVQPEAINVDYSIVLAKEYPGLTLMNIEYEYGIDSDPNNAVQVSDSIPVTPGESTYFLMSFDGTTDPTINNFDPLFTILFASYAGIAAPAAYVFDRPAIILGLTNSIDVPFPSGESPDGQFFDLETVASGDQSTYAVMIRNFNLAFQMAASRGANQSLIATQYIPTPGNDWSVYFERKSHQISSLEIDPNQELPTALDLSAVSSLIWNYTVAKMTGNNNWEEWLPELMRMAWNYSEAFTYIPEGFYLIGTDIYTTSLDAYLTAHADVFPTILVLEISSKG